MQFEDIFTCIVEAEWIPRKINQITMLIIDEWLLRPLGETDAGDVLEIIESRYHVSSTILCSQYKIEGWHLKIDSTPLAEAILDRIKHNSYRILIEGNVSMRERKGLQDKPQ